MTEKEKKIKEQRTIEATKKGLMGLNGKLGIILKHLGSPIISHNIGGDNYSCTYLDDPYELPTETKNGEFQEGPPEFIQKQIPYMDIDGSEEPTGGGFREERDSDLQQAGISNLGWYFEGLTRGMHLEVKYLHDSSQLTVNYKGYVVYDERAGELAAYNPNSEWEGHIERIFNTLKGKEKETSKENKEEETKSANRSKLNWLKTMKERWGI